MTARAGGGTATLPTGPGGFVAGSTTDRRAQFQLGGGGGGVQAISPFAEAHQRFVMRLPVKSTKWRIRIRNAVSTSTSVTAATGAFNFTGIYLGTPVQSTDGSYSGDFTGAPGQALSSFSTAADGSDYVSGWVTDPTLQFSANTDLMLSMGWTSSAPTQIVYSTVSHFRTYGVGKSADAAVAAASGISRNNYSLFDIRIEYEFTGTNRIGIAIGDSLTEGFIQDSPFRLMPAQVWHNRYALKTATPMCCSATFGTRTNQWNNTASWKWQRWVNSGLTIDFAIVYLGSNDVNSNESPANYETYMSQIVAGLTAAGIKHIYLATVSPRANHPHAYLNADHGVGVSAFTVDKQLGANFSINTIQLGTGFEAETLTVSSVTGTGPYTINTTGNSTLAHAKGSLVGGVEEWRRQSYNSFIREIPLNADGVVNFDFPIARLGDWAMADTNTVGSDFVHWTAWGHSLLAAQIPQVTY